MTPAQQAKNNMLTANYNPQSGDYTVKPVDSFGVIGVTAGSSADVNITLPSAVGITGFRVKIMKVDNGTKNVVINTSSSQTIGGIATINTLVSQYAYVDLMSDGANWLVMGVWDIIEATSTDTSGSSGNFPNNGITGAMVSPTVQAGVWLCTGFANTVLNGATLTEITANINNVGTTNGGTTGTTASDFPLPTASIQNSIIIPDVKITMTSGGSVYFCVNGAYTGGPPKYRCRLTCVRVG